MPHFIKTGYWEKLKKGYLGYLNLDDLIAGITTGIIALLPSSGLTANETYAIQTANNPSLLNPFATINDLPVNPFTQYSLFASQTSTNAPVILPLMNTIGVIALTRSSVGVYTFLSSGLFIENKTSPNKLNSINDAVGNKITIEWTSVNIITIKTYNSSDVLTDGILDEQEFNIKVFV